MADDASPKPDVQAAMSAELQAQAAKAHRRTLVRLDRMVEAGISRDAAVAGVLGALVEFAVRHTPPPATIRETIAMFVRMTSFYAEFLVPRYNARAIELGLVAPPDARPTNEAKEETADVRSSQSA